MAQQLKRWESPRRQGRNHKGRGGSAKQRQYIKRQKLLRKRLQAGIDGSASNRTHNPHDNDQPKSSQHQKENTLQKRERLVSLSFFNAADSTRNKITPNGL